MVFDAELLIEVFSTRLDEVLGIGYLRCAAGEEDQRGEEDAEDEEDKKYKTADE